MVCVVARMCVYALSRARALCALCALRALSDGAGNCLGVQLLWTVASFGAIIVPAPNARRCNCGGCYRQQSEAERAFDVIYRATNKLHNFDDLTSQDSGGPRKQDAEVVPHRLSVHACCLLVVRRGGLRSVAGRCVLLCTRAFQSPSVVSLHCWPGSWNHFAPAGRGKGRRSKPRQFQAQDLGAAEVSFYGNLHSCPGPGSSAHPPASLLCVFAIILLLRAVFLLTCRAVSLLPPPPASAIRAVPIVTMQPCRRRGR